MRLCQEGCVLFSQPLPPTDSETSKASPYKVQEKKALKAQGEPKPMIFTSGQAGGAKIGFLSSEILLLREASPFARICHTPQASR